MRKRWGVFMWTIWKCWMCRIRYADAVLWAVKEDITKGTTNTTFSPDADCTRAQIVTFLYRFTVE